jgi:hypothetical protein
MSPDEWKDLMRTDYAVYWQLADEYLKMPLPEFLKNSAGEKLSELLSFGEGRRPQNVMLMLASSIGSIRVVYARGDLHWMILDIECALTRYRTRHGRYPDKLDELKDLMLSDGIDPFSGKPLHYRLEDDGSFTIWSAGRNLADDGGALPDKHDPWRGEDYVWNSRLLSAGN